MSKKYLIIVSIFVLVLAAVLIWRGEEDTWICQDGQWVKRGNPSAPMPTEICGTPTASSTPTALPQAEIEVFVPQPNSIIKSPLILQGKARGNWFFEASAPVKLVEAQGKEIAVGFIQAIGDWMTTDFVPFQGELKFSLSATTSGILIFNNDNPSGLPENSKEFQVPVTISPEQATVVRIYFNNDRLDPEFSCDKVFSVLRYIPKTPTLARAALEELLKGPAENEKALGFLTSINQGVKIQRLVIENEVAKVDFDEQLEFQVGGSCRVAAIRAQITETLKQFATVKDVIISIDDRADDILQP